MESYPWTLGVEARERAISRLGVVSAFAPFVERLERGLPVTIGQLGASVGQDGGCLAQPYRRCNDLSGVVRTTMQWGRPLRRKFKGYLVRFFETLNGSYPHAAHQLNNSASDATPPQSALDCLFSHLPRKLDLVILEFGSMARSINYRAAEALLRVLLSLQPRPAVLFLTVREWCRADRALRFGEPQAPFKRDEKTPWAYAEETFESWCDHYGVGCLSYHRALVEDVAFWNSSRGAGYTFRDIGYDCLHPLKGQIGTEVMTDILVHWLRRAVAAATAARRRDGAQTTRGAQHAAAVAASGARAAVVLERFRAVVLEPALGPLPPPLQKKKMADQVNEFVRSAASGRCYSLLDGYNSPMVYQRLHPAVWSTANCANASVPLEACARWSKRQPCLSRALVAPPPVWFYCLNALVPSGVGKKSPGLIALVPGATLDIELDTRLGEGGGAQASLRVLAKLQYLTSYEHMGRAVLRCVHRCRCRPQRIDAHQVASGGYRNVSVFAYHEWPIRGAFSDCRIRLHVLRGTSSGEHKFKVRHVILKESAPNASLLR